MKAKTFEVRDSGTFIPVLAVKLEPSCEEDRFLFARAGFGIVPEEQANYVMLWRLNGGNGKASTEPGEFNNGSRTMMVAHRFIKENFETLGSGSVVDVQFIMGETPHPKSSEAQYGC